MRMQPEAKFKRRLVTSFKKHVPGGWYTYIVKGPGQKDGLPDLLFGQQRSSLLWVEAKMPTGRKRASQNLMHARLLESDQRVLLVFPCGSTKVAWSLVGRGDGLHDDALGPVFWNQLFTAYTSKP